MIKCPCYKCLKRKVTTDYNCHSDCREYKEYRFDLELQKIIRIPEKDITDYTVKEIEKRKKKKNEKHRS